MKKILFFITALLFVGLTSKSQSISVSGTPTFSALSVTEAGNNFTTTASSATNATLISISRAGNRNWNVNVKRVDGKWNSNLKIMVKRGTLTGYIWNGDINFQEIPTTYDSYFFGGYGNRSNIPIQYQVSNISMTLPADSYSTTIYYTVYQN